MVSQTRSDAPRAGGPRGALPVVLTSFIGRQRELEDARRLLRSSRLVTFTGAAGSGKTRLALRLAEEVQGEYTHGAHWVELAPLADPSLVAPAIAKTLQIPEQPGRSALESLLDFLQDSDLLLILDNCEHLSRTCAELAETVLLSAPRVKLLATSREPLYVAGERRYPVSPMALPPLHGRTREVGAFDAVQLFAERARGVHPSFDLTPETETVVASICHQLDGLPLAIELVSTRVNVLTLDEIAARLDQRLDLTSAPRQSHNHHRTLRGALDWSFDHLPAAEQLLLRRLSVFAGGCSLATARAVYAGDGIQHEDILDLLSTLVDRSLVVAHTLGVREARYTLLETIRQYAAEKLAEAGEQAATRDRHLHYFLKESEDTESRLGGEQQQKWLDWLEDEHPNIRAALAWALESRHVESGLRIVNALYQYWTIRDHTEEGFEWLDRLLPHAGHDIPAVLRAQSLAYAALLAGFRGRVQEQVRYGRESALLAEAAGDQGKLPLVWALSALAHGTRATGDYEAEFAIARRVTQLRRELGDPYFLGLALTLYSPTAMNLGRYDEARAMLEEGLPLLRKLGNPYRVAMGLNYSGDLARCEKRYRQATTAYEEASATLRQIGAMRDVASVLHNWGHAVLHLGDAEHARSLFLESLEFRQAQRNTSGMAECLIGFAALAVVRGTPGAAARLLAAAESLGGPRIASAWAATRQEYEHYLALARDSLAPGAFDEAESEGRAFSLDQAVDYARGVAAEPFTDQVARPGRGELTAREREVAALIAWGESNGEIADRLVVSKRTVEKHIANILAKLELTSRAQVVRWAIEHELVETAAR